MALALGYLIIAVVLLGLFLSGILRLSTSLLSEPSSSTIVYNAGLVQLGAGGFVANGFSLESNSLVQGAFNSTSPVVAYIVPNGAQSNFTNHFTFSTAMTTSARISVLLAPGEYYFIFADPAKNPANVTIMQNIQALKY